MSDGLDSLKLAFKAMTRKSNENTQEAAPIEPTEVAPEDVNQFLFTMMRSGIEYESRNENRDHQFDRELQEEINYFNELFATAKDAQDNQRNGGPPPPQEFYVESKFWQTYGGKLKKLRLLSRLLRAIPASSAFIERFFSICGIICDVRSGAMTDALIKIRCLLKANFNILQELNKKHE